MTTSDSAAPVPAAPSDFIHEAVAEDLRTGHVRHISTAYIVYVALDDQGKPTPVPTLLAETDQEKKRQAAARVRREFRLRRDEALRTSAETFGEG